MESLYSVNPCPFANKASLFPKQDFFASQSMLLYFPNKTSLFPQQDFFAMHPSLVCAKTKSLWRTPTCYVCLFLHIHNSLAKG